jgi:hypothetical protein
MTERWTIKVATRYGVEGDGLESSTREADCIARCNGWALTRMRSEGPGWSVTHEASGRRLIGVGSVLPVALRVFGAIVGEFPDAWPNAPFGAAGKAADFHGAQEMIPKARASVRAILDEVDAKIERRRRRRAG